MKSRFVFLSFLGLLLLPTPGWSRYPPLFHLDPPGGQRGTVVEVAISGERLSDFEDLMFLDEGIELAGHDILTDTRVVCRFNIAPDAQLGTHPLRMRTRSGISHLVLFSVGNLEEVFEVEPNDAPNAAQPIRKGTTINGRSGFDDVDNYSLKLHEGERLSVEIEGMRLGENHWDRNFCLFDAEMKLFGPDGDLEVYEDDTLPLTQDPAFVYYATREGTYTLAVSDSAFAGFGGDRYRLHVGEFPRPQTLSPMGASPGETVEVKWIGDPGVGLQTTEVPKETPFGSRMVFADRGNDFSPTGFAFRVTPYPNVFETEPNGDAEPQAIGTLPCAVEGSIDPAGDVDVFTFEGREGQSLNFHIYARNDLLYESRLGSSLDSRLAVLGPGGEAVVWEDDTIGLDSVGEGTLPADGLYRIFVYDHRRWGGPEFPYRLEIRPSEPTLDMSLEVDFLGYQPPAMPAYRGNRTAVIVKAKRKLFEGMVTLELPNLPPGVTAEAPPLPPGEVRFPLLLSAEADAPLSGSLVRLDAASESEGRTIRGGMKQEVMLAFGRDYNPYLYETVDSMAVAVAEEAPYRIEVLQPEILIERGGSALAKVRVARSPGFAGAIRLSAPWTPRGIACGGPTLRAGETEIEIEISASADAVPGVRRMLFMGRYEDYPIASPFFDLRVLGPETEPIESAVAEETHMMAQVVAEPAPVETAEAPPPENVSEAPVEVAGKESDPFADFPQTVSFRREVLPILTKFGCNSAACHGHKAEENSFYLSLFGHDSVHDHLSLLGGSPQPRIVPGSPDESLAFLKSSGQERHEGGMLLAPGSEPYRLLRTWIEEGARQDPEDAPIVEHLEMRPAYAVLDGKGVTRRFSLEAVFSDGSRKDVSDLATFSTADPLRASIDGTGLATSGEAGQSTLLGRYGNLSACAQVVCRPEYRAVDWTELEPSNYIDERVFEKLRLLRIAPAEPCEDHEFLRRAYLDVIGSLPTVEETRCFLDDPNPDKRAKLIEQLLERPEFADVWATKWSDYLHVRSEDALDRKAMLKYSDWIRTSVATGDTPAQLATDILTAQGGAFDSPATNFYKKVTPAEQFAEDAAQVFLGIRLQCAKCHDHPFDRWTMDDYYSFVAFFGRTFRKNSEDRRQALVYSDNSYGEVTHPNINEVMRPKFLAGAYPETEGFDRRAVLAEWIVSGTNPWFARNVANRVWEHFFGVGLVSPVDDFRDSNPPTHPQLLEDLAKQLVEYDYDIKPLIRDIAGSNVYQLSCVPRDLENQDAKNYSHFPVRRLDSETLADALAEVAERPFKFPYYPLGYRAMELPNGFSEDHFLTVFGRPPRVTVCAEERQRLPTLSQGLALMNGDRVGQACSSSQGRLKRLLESGVDDSEIVSEIYLATLSRPPTLPEAETHTAYLASAGSRESAFEDILWAVLNSKEFLFQH